MLSTLVGPHIWKPGNTAYVYQGTSPGQELGCKLESFWAGERTSEHQEPQSQEPTKCCWSLWTRKMELEVSISCKSLRSSKEFLIWKIKYFNKYATKLCQNLEPQK